MNKGQEEEEEEGKHGSYGCSSVCLYSTSHNKLICWLIVISCVYI